MSQTSCWILLNGMTVKPVSKGNFNFNRIMYSFNKMYIYQKHHQQWESDKIPLKLRHITCLYDSVFSLAFPFLTSLQQCTDTFKYHWEIEVTSTPTRPVKNVITMKGLQDRKNLLLDGRTVKNKGKLILNVQTY